VLVERDRQPLEVREQALAKFEHHIFAQLADQRDEGAGGDRLRDDGAEERGHDDRQRHQVTVVDQRRDARSMPRPTSHGPARAARFAATTSTSVPATAPCAAAADPSAAAGPAAAAARTHRR
jgi:hypothetical protein